MKDAQFCWSLVRNVDALVYITESQTIMKGFFEKDTELTAGADMRGTKSVG